MQALLKTIALGALLLAFLWSSPLHAETETKRLTGFKKVTVLVSYHSTGQIPAGVSENRVRTLLELKLRANGLRVLTNEEDEKDPDLNPYVFLEIATLEAKNQGGDFIGFAYTARLSVRLFARIPINTARAPIEMWVSDTMGLSSDEGAAGTIERVVNRLADELLNDWLAANPRR